MRRLDMPARPASKHISLAKDYFSDIFKRRGARRRPTDSPTMQNLLDLQDPPHMTNFMPVTEYTRRPTHRRNPAVPDFHDGRSVEADADADGPLVNGTDHLTNSGSPVRNQDHQSLKSYDPPTEVPTAASQNPTLHPSDASRDDTLGALQVTRLTSPIQDLFFIVSG